jgi:hypothetical protein
VVHGGRCDGGSGRCDRTKGAWDVKSLPSSVECGRDKDSSWVRLERSAVLSPVSRVCYVRRAQSQGRSVKVTGYERVS